MLSHQFETTPTSELAPAQQAEVPESAGERDCWSHVAVGTVGDPRPAVQAALAQASGGQLARAGTALLQLQRSYGNRHVQQVVAQAGAPAPVVQTKLVLGAADDRYEREADRVARQVTSGAGGPALDADSRAPAIQRLASSEGGAVDAGVQQAIQSARGGGQPLPQQLQGQMEQSFGADFSGVRLHTDAQADQLNRSLQARAFTTGRDIFFRRGEYNSDSSVGHRLLAHELAHVVQQGQGLRYHSRGEVIQRAIGLEYEVQGTELWEQEAGVGEQQAKKLTYGTKIYKVPQKYHIESDDGRMEFVTTQFPESVEGVKRLREAVEDAAAFAKLTLKSPRTLQAAAVEHGRGTIKKDFLQKTIEFRTANGHTAETALRAKPQASFGIALQKFGALSTELYAGSLGLADFELTPFRPEGHSQAYERSIGTDIKQWIDFVEKPLENNAEQKERSKAWTGFMALLGHHLRQAAKGEWLNQPAPNRQELLAFYGDKLASPNKLPTVYPKASHPLMARTNFKKMWEEVQATHALPPDVDAALCKDLILGWTERTASDYVYPGGYYDDALDPNFWNTPTEQAKNAIVKGPTVGDWLDSIFVEGAQAPTMEGRIAPHLPKTPEKRGMGALKKTEEVGTAERRWQAPIFEYRFFEGLYPPEQWGALAARVGAVVRKINL